MILPSITTLIFGTGIAAALAALDWYVWRITPVRRYPITLERTRSGENDETTGFKQVA